MQTHKSEEKQTLAQPGRMGKFHSNLEMFFCSLLCYICIVSLLLFDYMCLINQANVSWRIGWNDLSTRKRQEDILGSLHQS